MRQKLKPLIIEEPVEFTPEQIEYFTKLWKEYQMLPKINLPMFLTGTDNDKKFKWSIDEKEDGGRESI